MSTLNELFLMTLKDIYFAEKAIAKTLPKLAKGSDSEQLVEAFQHHRDETLQQVERLEQVFQAIGQRAKAERCEAIEGLIEEGNEVMEEIDEGPVRDAGLAATALCVEHYEIARYTALIAWAETLGHRDAVKLLQQNLAEEQKAEQLLTKLGKSELNPAAMEAGEGEGGEEPIAGRVRKASSRGRAAQAD